MKKLFGSFAVFGFILGVFFSADLYGQNISDAMRLSVPGLGNNARALGMGNAYIGLSDDASASYYNPAGLGLLRKMEFSGGFFYNRQNNSASFINSSRDYSNSNTDLDQISFAFPFPTLRGSLVFGLSYNATKDFVGALKFDAYNPGNSSMIQYLLNTDVPYDLILCDADNNTPINGKLNQSGTVLQSGRMDNFTLSTALEIYKNLFFGVNVDIISGKYEYSREYYEEDLKGIYSQAVTDPTVAQSKGFQLFYLNSLLNWDLSGWDAKIGILYQLKDMVRFGATIQFPKSIKVKENFKSNGRSEFATGMIVEKGYDDKVEYDVVTPYVFSGGFALNYMSFIASAEFSLTDYTQAKFENMSGFKNPDQTSASLNKDIKDNLRAVVNYNLGLEYTFADLGLRLRAGYFVQPSPYSGDPSDFNKKYVTGGFGFLLEDAISIDFAYSHGYWKDLGDNYGYNLSRTYQDISYDKIILTGTYRF
jgi:long-subunit fatty acid transport protein